MEQRKILHVDMDAFFASVEQRDDVGLKGKPVAVGGGGTRGVVAAASYEARAYGVRSAMPGSEARRRCPDLIFVRPDFAKYKAASLAVFSIFSEVTEMVEGMSLDEAFLDVTQNHWGEPSAARVAQRIKEMIWERLQLTASAGVAPSKSVAKIASGYRKPNGLTVVPPERVLEFLHPLPIEKISGVGPATAKRLHALGLRKIADLAAYSKLDLIQQLGKSGRRLWELANGIDRRAVSNQRVRKSQSAERTFTEDILDLTALDNIIDGLSQRVGDSMKKAGRFGRTVTIKVRYSDFTTLSRSLTLYRATNDSAQISVVSKSLLRETEAGQRPIRLLGVGMAGFDGPDRQLPLPLPDWRH